MADLPRNPSPTRPHLRSTLNEPEHVAQARSWSQESLPSYLKIVGESLQKSHPTIASKRWIWRQYDHMVMLDDEPGSDAGVVHLSIAGIDKRLPSRTTATTALLSQPLRGGPIAFVEACEPCSLGSPGWRHRQPEFANPNKPEAFFMLKECVKDWRTPALLRRPW